MWKSSLKPPTWSMTSRRTSNAAPVSMGTSRLLSCFQCGPRRTSPRMLDGNSLWSFSCQRKVCHALGGLKKTLVWVEPSGFRIFGPQPPMRLSLLIVLRSASAVPGLSSASVLSRKRKGELVSAKARLLALPNPMFSELRITLSWPTAMRDEEIGSASSLARLSSTDALSTTTITNSAAILESTIDRMHRVSRSPPFQLTMMIESSGANTESFNLDWVSAGEERTDPSPHSEIRCYIGDISKLWALALLPVFFEEHSNED